MADSLRVRDLSVSLGGRLVLDRVTFDAPRGAVTAVIGPNGAGKSTLVKALAGLVPHTGAARLGDTGLERLTPRARARLVGYVPQESKLDAPVEVRQVVALGRFAHATGFGALSAADGVHVEEALAATDAVHLGGRRFTELSHGERRRVLIARALATEAPLLLLDEPTAALDVAHAIGLLDLVRRLAAVGRTVVVVLHPLGEAFGWSDHVVLLDAGSVAESGSPEAVMESGAIRRVFQVEVVRNGGLGFERLKGANP